MKPGTCLIILLLIAAASCKREERNFRGDAPSADAMRSLRLSALQPGSPQSAPEIHSEYEKNAYALNEGKTLFSAFNCVGCHAHGGGGMGPALMDDKWIYGHEPAQI